MTAPGPPGLYPPFPNSEHPAAPASGSGAIKPRNAERLDRKCCIVRKSTASRRPDPRAQGREVPKRGTPGDGEARRAGPEP